MGSLVQSFIPSVVLLGAILIISILLAHSRTRISDTDLPAIAKLVLIACALHVLHFSEEAVFEFHIRFPQLLGFPAMSLSAFLVFNIGWVLIWIAGTRWRHTNTAVMATFWFLGLASAVNLLAHPALSLITGGYFPGLFTSPIVGVMGIILSRKLYTCSASRGDAKNFA